MILWIQCQRSSQTWASFEPSLILPLVPVTDDVRRTFVTTAFAFSKFPLRLVTIVCLDTRCGQLGIGPRPVEHEGLSQRKSHDFRECYIADPPHRNP